MALSVANTVRNFIDLINRHDADGLAELMTDDHTFIDSLGNQVTGREKMRAGWRSYYAMCPDYWVTYEKVFVDANVVGVFGAAGGTIAEGNQWRIPAAWLAVVENGRIKEWRVYADNKPVYDILARRSGS
jgi:uncharacterized protein (TIGR02246 family)